MGQETAPEIEGSAQGPTAGPPSGNTRRGVLVGAGLLGVVGVAAACGGEEETTEPGGGDGGGGGNAGGGGGGAGAVAQTSEIPVGGGKIFKDQNVVVTQPAQGEFKAFDIKCTHRGCPVDSVEGGTINCPCHASKFSIADGSVQSGPAGGPLKSKQVTVEGESIKLA
ncbi:Ferredoxin subunit of nitrite reductase or a ring-hydroxylating dioxygenase [Thermomonospora echinospora]|uniref:Ferredoxin subunit of nitrite reductase or a ring-hydroxylating dioxygenase n=1 Tax=Thermomonospora echinospora TaxID=1992 RepID=A0A1H6BVI4_9ACTN|nr:Rieske (2Fe-2S) protein [Thermomonospora echinospora]SEG64731.1 Ferredoxin subunit of nitrite reductase or a ring-hydroxylating dioxygenase [Thermomonospora echinospora]